MRDGIGRARPASKVHGLRVPSPHLDITTNAAGNVVVEAYTREKVKGKSRRVSHGMLPVVTYSITEAEKLTSSNDN